MTLCLRIPWPTERWPFVALHFCRWGVQYISCKAEKHVYKIGIGVGRIEKWRVCQCSIYRWGPEGEDIMYYPQGRWFWRYWHSKI